MRLDEWSKNIIINAICKNFPEVFKIILFGSRADDGKKGGDIDLLVETPSEPSSAFREKINALAEIQTKLGERRIDLITSYGVEDKRLVVKNAYKDGLVLWER
ncbi:MULTISPECIES: nucleotidyltransferase domain-containing protein [unclassified Treponema]|uniref:nucleotidyltransferase domain-containing protein n=1 Tax=unclassified Treponema TaxID=2638727 RepID=UPI0020A58EA3|nr:MULTISPECIES: nucleotidyltransferase domain-containing protein [unclassified Treponema]UTC68236.1 nucleotidyltransferase domain-containing protein [Treponema sp. OMZ 789]UTC70956.1 nucleotidyltransferase domain-containing protein [Treponema sp. OMZ 790]UTC73696.1 nucleotidyltransferase domain-containing protein [Treponema sp. OMZ 791]